MLRTCLIVAFMLSALLSAGCQRAYFAALNVGRAEATQAAAYGPEPIQRLDVYRPATDEAAPVVVFFYGGRWQGGRRADYAFVGDALAARGVLTIIADYRQYPEVRFPVFVEDAALVLRWAHDHASEYGGDPKRLFLAGHSAGAHIAAMLATDARYLQSVGLRPDELRGVVGIAGPYDFLPLTDADLQTIFGPESRWPESQPVNFVDGDEPPFLLLHGDDDKLVWTRNSVRLTARLRAAGIPVEYKRYPDLGHVRILGGLRSKALAPTLADLLEFVQAH